MQKDYFMRPYVRYLMLQRGEIVNREIWKPPFNHSLVKFKILSLKQIFVTIAYKKVWML